MCVRRRSTRAPAVPAARPMRRPDGDSRVGRFPQSMRTGKRPDSGYCFILFYIERRQNGKGFVVHKRLSVATVNHAHSRMKFDVKQIYRSFTERMRRKTAFWRAKREVRARKSFASWEKLCHNRFTLKSVRLVPCGRGGNAVPSGLRAFAAPKPASGVRASAGFCV